MIDYIYRRIPVFVIGFCMACEPTESDPLVGQFIVFCLACFACVLDYRANKGRVNHG